MDVQFLRELEDRHAPVQLVLDGAIVENIEDHLMRFGLSGRPLFRETSDTRILLVGPWLVHPASDRQTLGRCVAAAQAAGKGVFWIGECAPDALYKHLRHLNAARMPDGRIVYFRHYDSDVLTAIIPLLNAQQAAHLFGPTQIISLVGGAADRRSVEKPDGLPEQVSGMIAFEPWQIDALDKRQQELSLRKIVGILRKQFPEQTASLNDAELYAKVVVYQNECHAMNLSSEWSLAQYAQFNIESNDGASRNTAWRNKIAKLPPSDADYIFSRGMYDLRRTYRERKLEEELTNKQHRATGTYSG